MSSHPLTDLDTPAPAQQQAMDRMYRLQRHIYDASRRYYLLGRDRLIADLDVPDGGSVLEVGCGTGRNLVATARRYPTARVFGFDISTEMLKNAESSIARHKLGARVTIAQGDALDFDAGKVFGVTSFDRVYFSYTLSMIPDWRGALAHAASMLTERGRLQITDFGQCESLPAAFRSGLFSWLRLFHVEPREDLASELARLAKRLGASTRFAAGHRGYDWHLSLVADQRASKKH